VTREIDNDEYGGYISNITFNDGRELTVNENDIVIFVGPNNAGKSQALRDLFELCDAPQPTTVIRDIKICKKPGNISNLLEKVSNVNNKGGRTSYSGLEFNFNKMAVDNSIASDTYMQLRPLYVKYLDTMSRLSICGPVGIMDPNNAYGHPILYAANEPKYRKWLSSNFKKAFGKDIIPNKFEGSTVPLCIGEPVKLPGEYADEQDRLEDYASILKQYPQVQNQGDGIKSFTGILLYLMIDYLSTFLIDEPESFLHPPQANIMGRTIGEALSDRQQAFIATHSEEVIKGLLAVCPERVKVVRITRRDNINSFSILENEAFDRIWKDPLLRFSNIMTSLFHKKVVLCESDSDCKMYSIINTQLCQERESYDETLFIHCGGKHRMAKVIEALKSLNISVSVIVDIDVLDDENVFRELVDTIGISWDTISQNYKIVTSNVVNNRELPKGKEVKQAIDDVIRGKEDVKLSSGEIKNLKKILSVESGWKAVKQGGVSMLPPGDATKKYSEIEKLLSAKGLYIVPVGELEGFIKSVGGHGPNWVNSVLEEYPNLKDDVYAEIRSFVSKVIS